MTRAIRILLIDNYDSYAYNLFQRLGEITGHAARVVRNDAIVLEDVARYDPSHVVISPGPGNPEQPRYLGISGAVILQLGARVPVLGVCLGHQGIGAAFGARVVRAPAVMHGKTSSIRHVATPLFRGVANPFVAMRYHSLMLDPATIPDCLRVTAWSEDGVVMAIEHVDRPIWGVQFHPESIGTPAGTTLLRNFVEGTRRVSSGRSRSSARSIVRHDLPVAREGDAIRRAR